MNRRPQRTPHSPVAAARVAAGVIAILVLAAISADAHPLGNFTINHYAAINARPDGVTIGYVLDMAEIPTFQEIGRLDEAGMARHLEARLPEWARGLDLTAGGVPVPVSLRAARASCLPGVGGLPILRVEEDLAAQWARERDSGQIAQLIYRDTNFPDRVGWKEIVVTGREVQSSSVPATDRGSNRLRAYPVDLLQSPPEETVARFSVRRGGADGSVSGPSGSGPSAPAPSIQLDLSGCHGSSVGAGALGGQAAGPRYAAESTAFGTLFKRLLGAHPDVRVFTVALLGAFVLGTYHALTPGHGKTILAAYFIGSRGTAAQAALLGGVVTLTHTSGVFLLGFATLAASRYVLPEKLYPWLSVLSGVLLVGMGAALYSRRLRALRSARAGTHMPEGEHDHGHGHHGAAHDHHALAHHHGHEHTQACKPHHAHHHDHGHGHAHGHHHHLPTEETVRARDLITLGVTGGLLPCPSALVVMLAAISMGQVGFGLLLITAFSLGLAGVLTVGGLLMVYARSFMARVLERKDDGHARAWWHHLAGPALQRLPVISAAVVAVLGLVIVIQSVLSLGLIR